MEPSRSPSFARGPPGTRSRRSLARSAVTPSPASTRASAAWRASLGRRRSAEGRGAVRPPSMHGSGTGHVLVSDGADALSNDFDVPHWTHLHAPGARPGKLRGDADGLVDVVCLDEIEAGEDLLGLGERSVHDGELVLAAA